MAHLKISAQNKYRKSFDECAIELLGMAFLFYAGSYSIKAILSGLGLGTFESIGSLAFYILWAYALLKILLNGTAIRVKLIKKILFWELVFVSVLYINVRMFAYTEPYVKEYEMFYRQIIIVFLPCGVVVSQIRDFRNAFERLCKYAWYGSLIMLVALPLGYMSYWEYQYWGVQLSPFLIILFESYCRTRKKQDLLMTIVDIVLILLGGRQSFIVVFTACLLLYIYDNRKQSFRILIIVSSVAFLLVLFISGMYVTIFQEINHITNSMGIHMEALERIANGKLFDTSTRDIIYEYSMISIKSNGAKISGLLADRYYLRKMASWMAYPHNIYLELLMDFGTILGTILSLYITLKAIKSMLFVGDEHRKRVGIIICVLVFVRLFVSNSFVIEGYFYIMLGFMFGINSKGKWRRI